jgi:hypothetical protein
METTGEIVTLKQPQTLQNAMEWLSRDPEFDPVEELTGLRQHLRGVLELGKPPLELLKLLDAFAPRVASVAGLARPLLSDSTLPLPRRLRSLALALIDVHGAMAQGFLRIASEANPPGLANFGRSRAQICGAAMSHLASQLQIALLTTSPAPLGLWQAAQKVYELTSSSSQRNFKVMLALSAAQPEAMTGRQIDFLVSFLNRYGKAIDISDEAPTDSTSWYWLDPNRDLPPVAFSKLPPPPWPCLFFSCADLGRVTQDIIEQIAGGRSPEQLELPDEVVLPDNLDLLRLVRAHWASPPKRQLRRRSKNYPIQVCADLENFWKLLNGEPATTSRVIDDGPTDWMVVNESPGGYAVMHVNGNIAGMQTGSVLGVRPTPKRPWGVCLVRWARSENPEHLELGLEFLAPTAEAVRIVSGKHGKLPLPAFLLPALPGLDRGESLLVQHGNYYPHGSFTLLQESWGHIRITECHPRALISQTSCVEIYEFERDPLPL